LNLPGLPEELEAEIRERFGVGKEETGSADEESGLVVGVKDNYPGCHRCPIATMVAMRRIAWWLMTRAL
jgi:hypothetical protein